MKPIPLRQINSSGNNTFLKRSKKHLSVTPSRENSIAYLSSTQSIFPVTSGYTHSFSGVNSPQTFQQFYQTIGYSSNGQWKRPQSKHGCRNTINRPQTSKGYRGKTAQNENNNHKAHNHIETVRGDHGSKSMYQSQDQNKLRTKKQQEYQDDIDIKIVINRRDDSKKKTDSLHTMKFETKLPEEFLALFAN